MTAFGVTFDASRLPRQDGRLALVTGSNTGLGYHNAADLAAKGARVVMACRSRDRASDAMARITADQPGAQLEFLQLDLSSLEAVRASAAAFRERHESLDLLINNAGIMMTPYEKTIDGFEGQMATNYWGHFLLTMLLIDRMPDSSASRVVTLSSLAHVQGKIRFEDPHWEDGYDRSKAYRQTKLACLMFTLELDRRLRAADRQILSVASHPGISDTELGRSLPAWQMALARYTIGPFIAHDPDQASLPTLLAAIDPDVSGGDYYGPTGRGEMKGPPGPAKIHDHALDTAVARDLWDLSAELTNADLPFGS